MMKHNLAKGAFYLTISSMVFMVSGYIINIWLGRQLGPEAYGIYGIIISLITVINLTQTAGLPSAVAKYAAGNNKQSDAVYTSGLITQIVSTTSISVLFFLLSKPIALLLHDPNLTPYLQLSSLIFPLYGIFALLTGYYNGLHLFKKQAILHIVYSILKIFFIIVLAKFFHLYGVIFGFIISTGLTLLAGFRLPKNVTTFPYKKLILFSLPLIGIAIFSNLLQSIDLFFIKALLQSDKDSGFYTAGQNISRIPFFALNALSVVLLPGISRTVSQKKKTETRKLIGKSLRTAFLLCMPLVLIMSATSSQLLELIYSSQYLPASQSLSILLIGTGFLTIFTLVSTMLSGAGKPKIPFIISIISVTATACLCFILIPLFGLNGAALATTVGCFLAMILGSIFLYGTFKTFLHFDSFIKIASCSILTYIVAQLFMVPTILLPLFYILLFALYFGLLTLLKEVTKEDVDLIRSMIPNSLSFRAKPRNLTPPKF